MPSFDRRRTLRVFAVVAAISTYSTIVLGGSVSSSGAGLACPDWPLCHGAVVPDLSRADILIEYTHRLVAALTSLFLFLTMVLALLWFRWERRLVFVSTMSVLLLAGQVTLGMLTITSRLDPAVVTTHLAFATATFAGAIATAILALLPPAAPAPSPAGRAPSSLDEAVH